MRTITALGISAIALAACGTITRQTSQPVHDSVLLSLPEGVLRVPSPEPILYYDRNHNGIVDLELHENGCCDRTWARIDSDFSGRYDLEVHWGYGFTKEPIDIAVPNGVQITDDESDIPRW